MFCHSFVQVEIVHVFWNIPPTSKQFYKDCHMASNEILQNIHKSTHESIQSHDTTNYKAPYLMLYAVHLVTTYHGPLTRYAKLLIAHARGMPRTFSPPPKKETASWRSRHASRHVRHARAVMHLGSLTHGDGENVPGTLGACAIRNFKYLVRGPWNKYRKWA